MIESNIYLEMILHTNLDLTPGFLISRRSGGLQKGCFWYFGVSFERFDKFVCQNDTAGAMNTPPKWLILLNSGVVIPPERLFFRKGQIAGT
ncbi:MAG: hypothetical protein ACLVLG_10140 [Anaerovoracaceae bacterium]